MELNLQRQSITINEVVYDGFVEQPIECDALLPDFCPDIVKVLKCAVVTNVGSTAINGDRLTIEGAAVAHVYYCAEKGAIRHTEYKIPFAKVVDLRSAPSFPVVTVKPGVDYVNCRAVNQRRVDVRGAISFAVRVTDQKQEQVISDAQGGGLQLRRDMVQATDLVGQHDVSFAITEDLELGHGKPAVNAVLRTDCHVNVQDHKIVAGKVVAKGELLLHICYQSMEGDEKLEVMEYALPLSQIIESDGTDEDCLCDVEMYVVSCDVQPRQNGEGEYLLFALDAKVKAVVAAYRHKEMSVATDCYSTRYESSCKTRPVSFARLVGMVRETMMHKASLDLPEGLDCVLDAWCEVDGLTWKYEAGNLQLTLKVCVSMFARMEDGEVLYFEQISEAEHSIAVAECGHTVQFEPSADVLSCAYSLVGKERIDVRCEVLMRGSVLCEVRCSSLGEITVNEEKPKARVGDKLYIYYADEGESIWNIAKHYNTSAGAIWEENSVEDDILPGKAMLLIPIV